MTRLTALVSTVALVMFIQVFTPQDWSRTGDFAIPSNEVPIRLESFPPPNDEGEASSTTEPTPTLPPTDTE